METLGTRDVPVWYTPYNIAGRPLAVDANSGQLLNVQQRPGGAFDDFLLSPLAAAQKPVDPSTSVRSGAPGQRLLSGRVALKVDVKLTPFANPYDRTGVTMGMPQLELEVTIENVGTAPLPLSVIELVYSDGDRNKLTHDLVYEPPGGQRWILQPRQSQTAPSSTNGYAIDPESARLDVTVRNGQRTVIGRFHVNIAQKLPADSVERERKRREVIREIGRGQKRSE